MSCGDGEPQHVKHVHLSCGDACPCEASPCMWSFVLAVYLFGACIHPQGHKRVVLSQLPFIQVKPEADDQMEITCRSHGDNVQSQCDRMRIKWRSHGGTATKQGPQRYRIVCSTATKQGAWRGRIGLATQQASRKHHGSTALTMRCCTTFQPIER